MPAYITRFEGEYYFLSNFYEHTFEFRDHEFQTAEHAYQGMKAIHPKEFHFVRKAPSPSAAKKRGQNVDLRDNWDRMKIRIMRDILEAKFSDPDLRERLEMTYPAVLIEGNDWGDDFWGVADGTGQNWLGRLLMQVRDKLYARQKQ